MALSEIEKKRIERSVGEFMKKRRPRPEIRHQVDFGFRVVGQSLELFAIRPAWKNPAEKQEHPFAKATYVGKEKSWKIFWMRADMKWHRYPPAPKVKVIEEFLEIVDRDENACFFG